MSAGDTVGVRVEIAVEGVADAQVAEAGGADRIELCSALLDGGLTPSLGLARAVVAAARIPVFVLVRPRGGDFVLEDDDLGTMAADIEAFRAAGASGIVLGALTPEGDVDAERVTRLVDRARPLPVTFHRAFDHARAPLEALERLRALGLARVLTSGQAATAEEGAALLQELVAHAGDELVVVAGGGVRASGVRALVARTGVREVHASAAGTIPSPARHRNPAVPLGPSDGSTRRRTDPGEVRALVAAVRGAAVPAPRGRAAGSS